MSAMTELQFQHVHKAFGTTLAVSDVSFRIASRSFGVVIGPSGCGKSTLLSLAAGLDEPSSGYVFLGGREVRGIRDDVALLFQNYNLFPWMTAQANVAFGLTMRGMSQRAASVRALDYLNDVGLGACAPRIPDELSRALRGTGLSDAQNHATISSRDAHTYRCDDSAGNPRSRGGVDPGGPSDHALWSTGDGPRGDRYQGASST